MRACFPDLNPVVWYLTAKLRTEISRPFSMEIVMLVSWAIWTPRNDFIIKGYWIKHKSAGHGRESSGLSSFRGNDQNMKLKIIIIIIKEFGVLIFNYFILFFN
jgi:hypothetical protein